MAKKRRPKKLKAMGEMTVQGTYDPANLLSITEQQIVLHLQTRTATGRTKETVVQTTGFLSSFALSHLVGESQEGPFFEVEITPPTSL